MTNGLVLYMDGFCLSDRINLIFTTAQYFLEALTALLRRLLRLHPLQSKRRRMMMMMIPKHSFAITSILALI